MLVSHEVPKSLLDLSLLFNDYDYFLIHQIFKFQEYRDFFKKSKDLNRRQILDNSLYELKETFDPDVFADYIKELKPSEYLIPDCFNDFQKNLDLFDDWMSKYCDLPGLKIATIHGKTMKEFQDAYDIFKSYIRTSCKSICAITNSIRSIHYKLFIYSISRRICMY